MDTCSRIFDLLDKTGMEQQEFAKKIGTTKHVVSKWRTGDLQSYRKYLPQIAEVLHTSVQWLLTGEGEKNNQAAVPKDNGLTEEFARLFQKLTPEKQNEVIAEMLKRLPDQ